MTLKDNKKIKIGVIVGAVVVVIAIIIFVLFNVATGNPEERTYSFSDTRRSINRYAHFLVDGEKNDQSDLSEIDEKNKTYLERVLDDDEEKNVKQDFMKSAKELGDDVALKISHLSSGESFENVDQFIEKVGDVKAETNMLAEFYNTNYSVEGLLKYYVKDPESGISEYLMKKYDDLRTYGVIATDGIEGLDGNATGNTEEEDESSSEKAANELGINVVEDDDEVDDEDEEVDYRIILSDTEKNLADFYNSNFAYSGMMSELLDYYYSGGCIKDEKIEQNCRNEIDKNLDVVTIKKTLDDTLNDIKNNVKEAKNDLPYNVQWLAVNFRKQR